MSTYARRIVSGSKARFRDNQLNVDLDLVYLTDRIILMGYPASGVAAYYRNKGEDARRFLDHRHEGLYWVFNFCPCNENQYPASLFDGRVSRYPFPDHHAPPMALLALATREMDEWLSGDPDRVIVLHCKAGKGRTGTLACAYLLACGEAPSAPKLQRSYSSEQWARLQATQLIRAVDSEDSDASTEQDHSESSNNAADGASKGLDPPSLEAGGPAGIASSNTTDGPSPKKNKLLSRARFKDVNNSESSFDGILDLHTSRRMKPSDSPEKMRRGVSISSQRRFLYYWSLLILSPDSVPRHFWSPPPIFPNAADRPDHTLKPKVWLKEIRVRMREPGTVKRTTMSLINTALETVGIGKNVDRGKGDVWVSLARYNDDLVDLLESWEKKTRGGETLGKRPKEGVDMEHGFDDGPGLKDLFTDGRWDKGKMVRSFAKLGAENEGVIENDELHERVKVYTLRPLATSEWVHVKPVLAQKSEVEDDSASMVDERGAEETDIEEGGVLLDAGREVRAKLYMGQVSCFDWQIFHMPQPPPERSNGTEVAHFSLQRRKVDFPLGPGSWLIDVDVTMAWAGPVAEKVQPKKPEKLQSRDDTSEMVAGAVAGGTLGGVVEAVQAEKQ